ncbi:hypothetical protein ACO2Q1_16580 [Brevundimonas sp. VNH65]|uniref:hypothetical protein n=1 Tax=Brevundimonas sp. VNH65 TaxID=3400917 RepID=UPI003C0F26EB
MIFEERRSRLYPDISSLYKTASSLEGMMMVRTLLSMLALLAVSMAPANAQVAKGNVYEVSAKIYADGQLVGHPIVRVLAGSEVSTARNTVDGYAFRVTVDRDGARPAIQDAVVVRSAVYFPQNGSWVMAAEPEFQLREGGSSRFSSSSPNARSTSGFSIEISVRRTTATSSPASLSSLEDCNLWKALSGGKPFKETKVFGVASTAGVQVDGPNDGPPYYGNCCTSGNMTCCGTPNGGVCCRDGMTGNACCAPT